MEQKDKDLLLKDLCARLPYDIIVKDEYGDYIEVNIYTANLEHLIDRVSTGIIKMVLRPMSSMTEEEQRELQSFFPCSFGNQYLDLDNETIKLFECNSTMEVDLYDSVQMVDFCKKNHLDCYGLIKKGLALSTEDNNPYKH